MTIFGPIFGHNLGHNTPTVWAYLLQNNKLNAKIYHLNKHNDISCTTRDHQDDQKSTKKVIFFRVEIFVFLTPGADFASQDPISDKSRPFPFNNFKNRNRALEGWKRVGNDLSNPYVTYGNRPSKIDFFDFLHFFKKNWPFSGHFSDFEANF